MPHNPEKEPPRPERKLKLPSGPEEEGYFRKMEFIVEFIEGHPIRHPICDRCLAGIHDHPFPDEGQEKKRIERADCKNEGFIDGDERKYQCHCGFGGWCIDGKWESWEEDE